MVCGTKQTDQNDSLSKQGGHSAMYVAFYCMMCGWIRGFISAVCAHSTVEVATPPERSSRPFSLLSKGIDYKTLNWPNSNEYAVVRQCLPTH